MKREIVKKLRRGQELTVDEVDFVAEEFTKKRDYGLVWENHPESVDLELKDGYFDIREVKKKRILTNPDGRDNLLIEGDNLHSLMALKEAGVKIDVIYIDPPYNTLNEGFIYNDKIVDKEDSYRHSKWLSFMHKRLELARDLMEDDGVIFVSIDDNEQANLRLLMDQVFGEENFVANIIRRENAKKQKIGKPNIKTEHEYLICYKKYQNSNPFNYIDDLDYAEYNKKSLYLYDLLKKRYKDDVALIFNNLLKGKDINKYIFNNKEYKVLIDLFKIQGRIKGLESYKYIDNQGLYRDADLGLSLGGGHDYYINNPFNENKFLNRPKKLMPNKELFLKTNLFHEDKNGNLNISCPNKINKIELDKYSYGPIIFKENTVIRYKEYIDLSSPANTIILNHMGSDSKLVEKIGISFDHPKTTGYIRWILKNINNKNATILDFFAGSGTTGHAVMELNKEDGGNRRFILCTNNENNICEEVTYERNRRVITGEYAESQVDPLPNNLSYYKVNIKNIDTLSIDKKKELDLRKNIYSILWKNEYNIIEKNDKYLIVEKEEEKAAILLANIIDDNMRETIEGRVDCIYIPKHLSRDKLLKMFCDKEVIYY